MSFIQEELSWKVNLFDCYDYRNEHNDSMCIPFFFPMSVIGTCFMIGNLKY
jgi:hypothetical protein